VNLTRDGANRPDWPAGRRGSIASGPGTVSAVGWYGDAVTFDPTQPGAGGPIPTTVDPHGVSSAACPSESVYAAVDGDGREVSFDRR
jgi:hypothetical protein